MRKTIGHMDDFLDINVWIALSNADHPHNARAKKYFESEAATRICFCRVSAMGLVRIASQPNVVGHSPLTPQDSWALYERWRDRQDVVMVADPTNLDAILSRWVVSGIVTAKHWTDAYLAAVAVGHSLRLVTFDRDYDRFPGLNVLLLKS